MWTAGSPVVCVPICSSQNVHEHFPRADEEAVNGVREIAVLTGSTVQA